MKNNNSLAFPLSDQPSHYLACVENPGRLECTHVSIKLGSSTLIRLVRLHLVTAVLRLFGIKMAVFETKADALDVACLNYEGKEVLGANDETATDEAPYKCLSLGELASLGGYATDALLAKYFTPIKQDAKVYAVEVHAERFSMWLKVYFFGQTFTMETNPFNLDILVKDFLMRNVQRFLSRYLNQRK
jgi:hypothetical protein